MKLLIGTIFIGTVMTAGGAAVADSAVVSACQRVAQVFWAEDEFHPVEVQDFSALSPPGARIVYKVRSPIRYEIECEFTNATTPLELTRFCATPVRECYARGDRRFEEVNLLIEREGL